MRVNEYIPVHYVGKRKRVTVDTGDETIVEQHHEESTNINKIIARYRNTGMLPRSAQQGVYMDVSEVGDFMDTRLQMAAALERFNNLPPNIRDEFADAGEFMEYVERQQKLADQAAKEAAPGAAEKPVEAPPEPKPEQNTPPAAE